MRLGAYLFEVAAEVAGYGGASDRGGGDRAGGGDLLPDACQKGARYLDGYDTSNNKFIMTETDGDAYEGKWKWNGVVWCGEIKAIATKFF